MDVLQLGVVENHISIDLTISGMLLTDSWCQEAYVSSISTHYFDIKEIPLFAPKISTFRKGRGQKLHKNCSDSFENGSN